MNDNIEKLKTWLDQPTIDPLVKEELTTLYNSGNEEEINDRFYKDMEFGTGGLRGKIGAGTNRMNVHTVRRVSQAFAGYLLENFDEPSVVIAHDNRRFSDIFTFEAACIFAENGIKVYAFDKLTPTPMLSFGVRSLKASGGVVITASHNPKEYNGYKIYDCNGCQCLPDEALKVSERMETIDIFDGIKTCSVKYAVNVEDSLHKAVESNSLIDYVPQSINDDYYKQVMSDKALSGNAQNISLVYTPLNGTGYIPVTKVLGLAGLNKLHIVNQQKDPDPEFTTCPKPNPEEDEALTKGLELCEELKKQGNPPDLLLATDPDCDRVGVVVKNKNHEYTRLDGNQTGVLLLDFIIKQRLANNSLPHDPVMITTIVSTPMAEEIAGKNKIHTSKVLTGFKYIGGKIHDFEVEGEENRFIFGFEESCGYLSGTYVRDKDAVSASLLICEMAGFYLKQNKTLMDRLDELYDEYGYFITKQVNFEESGKEGEKRIKAIMDGLRNQEILSDFTFNVVRFLDYEAGTKRMMGIFDDEDGGCPMSVGTRPITNLPKENVLEFNFSNKSRVIIRPSGTEPKIKIYLTSKGNDIKEASKIIDIIEKEFVELVENM